MGRIGKFSEHSMNMVDTANNWKSILIKLKDSILTNQYKSLRLHFVDNGVASDWSLFLTERGYFNEKDKSNFLNIRIDDLLIAEYRDWNRNRQPIPRRRKKQKINQLKIQLQ